MAEQQDRPLLSAVLIVGSLRNRAQKALDALAGQSRAADMEILVGDLAAASRPPLRADTPARVVPVELPAGCAWAQARAIAARTARGDIVAFLEDHCYAQPGWADALIEAHKGPWSVVGYAFKNANPATYASRACLMADYGVWAVPAKDGPSRLLPYGNVSYKRAALVELGSQLDEALTPDFNAMQILRRRGRSMRIAADAIAAHENFIRVADLMNAKREFCRSLAARRVRTHNWGWGRRVAQAAVTPIAGPAIQAFRLARSLVGGRLSLAPSFLAALPVILASAFGAAYGETQGYLFGEGTIIDRLQYWEVEAERELKG